LGSVLDGAGSACVLVGLGSLAGVSATVTFF
jgi:hypothetical protein